MVAKDFAVHIAPLLQLAAIGKTIVEDTFQIFSKQEISSEVGVKEPAIPRLYSIPTSSASSNKRQNTSN